MPNDEIKQYATSATDFYELLGVSYETSQKEIDRAWRKTALKYHPDKVGDDASAKEKFHLAQIGYDLLSDPSSKAIYDNARTARLQRKRQNELFEGRRRQMKDDLEARERGVKRPREDSGAGEEERLHREIRRLAEDGQRRRREREEMLRKEMEKDGTVYGADRGDAGQSEGATAATSNTPAASGVTEIDRTVKVRWPLAEEGATSPSTEYIKSLFSRFGKIEDVHLLQPKRAKLAGEKKKRLAQTGMVTYASVVGAQAAVEDFPREFQQKRPEWTLFDSVSWATGKEPEALSVGQHDSGAGASSQDQLPTTSSLDNGGADGVVQAPTAKTSAARSLLSDLQNGGSKAPDAAGAKPSFGSFAAAKSASSIAQTSTFGQMASQAGAPSLEEMTMIRLRKLERKRLAAQLEERDKIEEEEK